MQRNCVSCKEEFEIDQGDLNLLKKLTPVIGGKQYPLPPPTHCYLCRYQRRMAMRNENKLYIRKCDYTGDEMVSLYAPDSPYTVFKEEIMWSDKWDPLDYGRDVDLSRSFFEQYNELRLAVPRRGMHQDGTAENCEYSTYGTANRNCYMAYACGFCEDVYHCTWGVMASNCVDCFISSGELLYECVGCKQSYRSMYCFECISVQDSYYLENCQNCHHCISCKNLRGKSYHIKNKPVTKQEFERVRAELHDGNFEKGLRDFDQWRITQPTLYVNNLDCENCTGNQLAHAKNCHNCFDIMLGAEDLRNCQFCGWKGKDMMDCNMAGKEAELLYEVMATLTSQRLWFTFNCQFSQNVLYSEAVKHLENCFGCIGMNRKKFCILNKQYSEQEYYELVPQIIERMIQDGEWGENFPASISPFAYNETLAQERFPMTKEEVLAQGWKWRDVVETPPEVDKVIPAEKLPKTISDVPDDVFNWAIRCEKTGRPFKIIAQELAFYRKLDIPIPHFHPEVRHARRAVRREPHRTWKRSCAKCNTEFITAYGPHMPDTLYCESCYLEVVYQTPDEYSFDDMVQGAKTSYRSAARKANAAKLLLQAKAKKKKKKKKKKKTHQQ